MDDGRNSVGLDAREFSSVDGESGEKWRKTCHPLCTIGRLQSFATGKSPAFCRRLRTLCELFPPSEKGFRPQVCRKNLQVPVWLVRSPLPNLATSGTGLGIFLP